MCGCAHGWLQRCMDRGVDGSMDACSDAWTDAWLFALMVACMHACTRVHLIDVCMQQQTILCQLHKSIITLRLIVLRGTSCDRSCTRRKARAHAGARARAHHSHLSGERRGDQTRIPRGSALCPGDAAGVRAWERL